MSTAVDTQTAPDKSPNRFTSWLPQSFALRWMVFALGAVFVLSILRVVADAPDLTDTETYRATLGLTVPILLAGLGGLFAERVGVVNIGLEGMMVLGTFGAGWAGFEYGPWWGVAAAFVFGALGGLLHALATVTFGVDQIISGVAINIIAPGIVRFMATLAFEGKPGGSTVQGPRISGKTGQFSLPILSGGKVFGWNSPDVLLNVWRRDIFFVSDLCGVLHGLTNAVSIYALIALALVPISAYVLWRTAFGLRLRSIGEKPEAADSLGVRVNRIKYIGVVLSGGLAGLGGGFLVLETGGSRYTEAQTANRGFIGLAALIFGNWRPAGVFGGAGLFGFAEALRLRSADSVLAIILLATVALVIVAVFSIRLKKFTNAIASLVVAAGLGIYYVMANEVPTEIQSMTPYVATLLVLTFASKRLRPPAAAGKPWRKGQTT